MNVTIDGKTITDGVMAAFVVILALAIVGLILFVFGWASIQIGDYLIANYEFNKVVVYILVFLALCSVTRGKK